MTVGPRPSSENTPLAEAAKAERQAAESGHTLARLFVEHNRSLQSFLRVRVGSQHDAEDDQGRIAHFSPNPSVSAFM